jgi:hypothetical protein
VSQFAEDFQITSWPAAEVENPKRPLAPKALQQHVSVLADVVISGALPKTIGVLIVVGERDLRRLREFYFVKLVLAVGQFDL